MAALLTSTHAWGFEAHKFIMERAIDLLPAEIRPFFEQHRSILIERAIDPDTWQVAGFNDQEDPNHFLDLDWEGYGKVCTPGCRVITRQRWPSLAGGARGRQRQSAVARRGNGWQPSTGV